MNLNKHIVKVIADTAIFLEFSPEDVIDADIAAQLLENIGYELQLMDRDNKRAFKKNLEELSSEYNESYREFVRELADNLGII